MEPLIDIRVETLHPVVVASSSFWTPWDKGKRGGHHWAPPGSVFSDCKGSGLLAEVSWGAGCRII